MAKELLKSAKAKDYKQLVEKTQKALIDAGGGRKSNVETCLHAMKGILYANSESDMPTELAAEVYSSNLMDTLVKKLESVPFESKKDIVQIFNKLVRREIGTRKPTVDHICGNPKILTALVEGYTLQQVNALSCGLMLRECIKNEPLAKIVINDKELFGRFYDYVQLATFDIAADAFTTFKDLLTANKILAADFLEKQYDSVFGQYEGLLKSENYVTRRQSLKLLGELLLDRANFSIMTKYIGNPENLKLMMNMLRDPSKNIQFEAFHVFKVFVANPNKSKAIMDILLKNKSKLIDFLTKFHESRAEDEQFADEKAYLINQIKELK